MPGRVTLAQNLASPDPEVAFDVIAASVRRKTAALARAIDAADFLAAWSAANDLEKTIREAERVAATPGSGAAAEVARQLDELRAVAAPLLEVAPAPTQAAVQEAISHGRKRGGRWEAEEHRWKATRGKGADAGPAGGRRTEGDRGADLGRAAGRGGAGAGTAETAAPPDLGDYSSETGRHVLVIRGWDDLAIAARRVELQSRLARTVEHEARAPLLREHEAVEWVARERELALPKDPGEEAAPQAFIGGVPTRFWVPESAQGMRAMLEREMAAGAGYDRARDHARQRIGLATASRSAADNDKQRTGDQQLALMDRDAAGFGAAFQVEAKHNARAMLSDSAVAIDSVLRSYGIAGGDFRLTEAARKVAKDPGSLEAEVDAWLALSHNLDGNRAAFAAGQGRRDALARAADRLRGLQQSIAELAAEQRRLMTAPGADCQVRRAGAAGGPEPFDEARLDAILGNDRRSPMPGSVRHPFASAPRPAARTPEQALAFARGALQARQAQYRAAWIAAEREHPILAAYRGRAGPDASRLAGIGKDESTVRSVIRQALPKLASIYRTRVALREGALDPLQLGPVVEITKQRMFVAEGSYRERTVRDLAAQARVRHGGLARWALEAVMIGLSLVTLVPTGGGSALAALALGGLAYDIYAGLEAYEDLKLSAAAADTDLDVVRSLSDAEPSLTPVLTRMLGAGLNLTVAAGLFQRAVAVRRMATSGALDRDAVAALNRAGEAAGVQGVGDEALSAAGGPRPKILEVFTGPDLKSAAHLAETHPHARIYAAERTAMPSARQIAEFRAQGGEFLAERFAESMPPNSFEKIYVRYPLPNAKVDEAVSGHLLDAAGEIMAREPGIDELSAFARAAAELASNVETMGNFGPHALEKLVPGGSLEVVFWERSIVNDLMELTRYTYIDPMTNSLFILKITSGPTSVPRSYAPHSGHGIPEYVSAVIRMTMVKTPVGGMR